LANTAGMIDLNGEFTVEMWVKFGKELNYLAGDETWPGVAKVERPYGWVLRIREDKRLDFTAGAGIAGRPGLQWAGGRGGGPVGCDDDWHPLAVSGGREGIDVFLDGKPYLHQTKSNITFMNSPFNIFLGPAALTIDRPVNCHFKAFRVSGKQHYSQSFTPA